MKTGTFILSAILSISMYSQTLIHDFNNSNLDGWTTTHWSWDSVSSAKVDTFTVGHTAFMQSPFNIVTCGDTSVFEIEVSTNIPKNDCTVLLRFQPSSVSPNWINISDSGTHIVKTTHSASNLIISLFWNRGTNGTSSEYYSIDYVDYGCRDRAVITNLDKNEREHTIVKTNWYDMQGRKVKGSPNNQGFYIKEEFDCYGGVYGDLIYLEI